jgi:4-hydroxy-3-methylbut-2-en-1-yl diphosphate reductase
MNRQVIRANVSGFCSGVKRAVDLALEAGATASETPGKGDICTLGELVHNRRVMEMLKRKGVRSITSPEEILDGTVVIRAHGAPKGTVEGLEKRGVRVVDATCPKVTRSHSIIERYSDRGYHVVVAGERNHSETRGLVSRANSVDVVETATEARELSFTSPGIVIAQTTFSPVEYEKICATLKNRFDSIEVFETVCPAMEKRREALSRLVGQVDALIIIGGRHSANTRRLFEQAKSTGLPAWHVEEADDLPSEVFGYPTIGITAGASTPDFVIDEVEERLRSFDVVPE